MTQPFTDIRHGDWIDRHWPAALRPYARLARLDRPIGWWLLLLPGWWSIALSAPLRPDLGLMALFLIGAIAMRGAGCTLNDMVDRDFDAQVERTRSRPIPSGAVSLRQAAVFLLLQLAIGAAVLFSLPWLAIELGLGVLVLIGTYPFMKRITFWPQLFLGLNFNFGALIGWVAAAHELAAPAIALYAAGIVWTLGYDTIYAHQDKEDDAKIGVKSTALRLGYASKTWIAGFYGAMLALFALAFALAGAGVLAYAALLVVLLHCVWQIRTWRIDDPADCLAKFKSNRGVGLLVLAGCLLAGLHW